MNTVNKGRKMVIRFIMIVLLIDIITVASVSSFYALNDRVDLASFKLVQGIIRFALTGLMLFFLYKGHRWAKWLSVVLFIIAGLMALLSLMTTFSLILLGLGLVYVFLGIMIISSSSVNAFFQYQRGDYTPDIDESIAN